MMIDYETYPLSREDIRFLSKMIRKKFKIKSTKFPILKILEELESLYGVMLVIEEDDTFDNGVMAELQQDYDKSYFIRIRNSVYEKACRGDKKCLGFICHEMCHFFLIEFFGFTPIFPRTLKNCKIPRYKSMEWQAKALCGELMIPFDIFCSNKDIDNICERTDSSHSQARYFIKVVCKNN